jgi:hypothetical protein
MELSVIFALGMILSAISGRTTLLATRGRIERPMNAMNAVRSVIGIFAGLCFWVLILWGFSSLAWYIALPIILAAGIVGGSIVNLTTFVFFYRSEWVVDVASLAITGWLWIIHWPY